MNEKYFVSYETARKLKTLGFDYPCIFYYTDENAPKGCVWQSCGRVPVNFNKNINECRIKCSAPTLWQAQYWLYVKHNIQIQLKVVGRNQWNYTLIEMSPKTDMSGEIYRRIPKRDNYPVIANFEDSISAAIDDALELITNRVK